MYHTLINLSLAAAIALSLCGCNAKKAANIETDTVEYETQSASVYIERPTFSIRKNKDVENKLNKQFDDEINSMLVAFDTTSANAGELLGGNKCVFELHIKEMYNENDFLSILSDTYEYTGGAHGQSVWTAYNIDTLNGNTVLLADLFEKNDYSAVLEHLIDTEHEKKPDEYGDLWEKPKIKDENQKNFYISPDGLTIFYEPYDLSYYARGVVEFTLPNDEIKPIVKEEYKKLFNTEGMNTANN